MDSPKRGVGGRVSTPAFLPAVNNSLVVAINHEWHAGSIESEQSAN